MTADVRTTQRAYPAYKGSGIEWLGDIPAHWETSKLAYLFTQSNAGEVIDKGYWGEGTELLFTCARDPLISDYPGFPKEKRTTTSDLLLTRNGTPYVHNPPPGAIYTNVVQRITLRNQLDRQYTSYALGAACLNLKGYGVSIESLNFGMWKLLQIGIPPLPEQEAIARFLDHKTAQIDALIAKKEALLARLADKRTALISQAVTKGLDPTVPLRDSGIEWLGEIPAHWEVLPLKYAVTFQRGHDLPAEQRNEGDVPLVSSSGVSAWHDQAKASGPGIVTGRYGTIGKFTYIEEDYWPLNTTLYSIDTHGNNVRFLWYMLHNIAPLFILNSQKSAVPGVDRNDLHPVPTAVPTRDEQDEIVKYLDVQLEQIDKQSDKVHAVVDKLKQYRTALITNAVTGKIDVREAGAWVTEAPASS